MKTKQYPTKQLGHWRNLRGNQKIPRHKCQWRHNDLKPVGHKKSGSEREVDGNTISPQEIRKISMNLTLHLKQWEGTNKTQS